MICFDHKLNISFHFFIIYSIILLYNIMHIIFTERFICLRKIFYHCIKLVNRVNKNGISHNVITLSYDSFNATHSNKILFYKYLKKIIKYIIS